LNKRGLKFKMSIFLLVSERRPLKNQGLKIAVRFQPARKRQPGEALSMHQER
jgi:hypothetical protein